MADGTGRKRAGFVFIALVALFFGLVFRLYDLQILGHESYSRAQDHQTLGFLDIKYPRGPITDATGEVVAVSIPVQSLFAEPERITDIPGTAQKLAAILNVAPEKVQALLAEKKKFAWIRRRLNDADVVAIRALKIPGLDFRTEYDRVYPHGQTLGHVLGLVNIDDQGSEGLEKMHEKDLMGTLARAEIEMDGRRKPLDYPDLPSTGANVQLTVDLRFQRVVEEALDAMCGKMAPKWAVAVAMDPRTGAILALASRPTFDPNDPVPAGMTGPDAAACRRNMVLVAPYEPGSTWKPFALCGALEAGVATPDTIVDCEMGAWKVGARTLHDHEPYGKLTLTEVVVHSSNIGAAKIGGIMLGAERLWKTADAFGFGRHTGVDLPAEDRGMLHPLAKWTSFSLTSVPMGHEISVTPMQLVTAMCAIANGGWIRKPYIVERELSPDGTILKQVSPVTLRRAMSEATCAQMRKILREVVKSGTGTKANIEGLEVAGKTGTTQLTDATGHYTHEKFISSFVGFAPQENAKVCIAVVVCEPHGAYYGGTVAAPVVAEILRKGMSFVR